MSTAGRRNGSPLAASDVAAHLRAAEFVTLTATASGDAVAATGLLARALDAVETPYQARVLDPAAEQRSTDADLTVAVGHDDATTDLSLATAPASATAFETAREIGADPDVALALAGVTASGRVGGPVAEAATASGIERRPGVAVPTTDLADGLAHSTLLHAPFSGDARAVESLLADHDLATVEDEDDRRRVASLVALETVGHPDATDRASDAIEHALRPAEGGPFATVGGYADVLDAAARAAPGTAIALAVGHDDIADHALDAWRAHAARAHAALRDAATSRYDGLFVVRGDDLPVGTVARLARDFRSPEPVALAVGDGTAAASAVEGHDPSTAVRGAATDCGGNAVVSDRTTRATFDADPTSFVDRVREAL